MFAYILGGMLAMSWTVVHKIVSYVIVYGFNLVELYKDLARFAQKQLDVHIENIWSPVIVLWVVYLFMGMVSAILGIYIGKRAVQKSAIKENFDIK